MRLFLILLLAPLSVFAKDLPRPEDPGRIEGWTYSQDYFGLTWDLPEEAAIQGGGWTKKAVSEAAAVFAGGMYQSAVKESASTMVPLVTLNLEATERKAGDEVTVVAVAEKLPEAFGLKSGAVYLDQTRQVMGLSGLLADDDKPAFQETIGGLTFDGREFNMIVSRSPLATVGNTLYAAMSGNHVLLFSLSYGSPLGLSRGRAILKAARFNPERWTKAGTSENACAGEGCEAPKVSENEDVKLGLERLEAKDYAQSLALFQKAADKGEAEGLTNLSYQYHHGLGAAKDLEKAVQLYRQAAKGGDGGGQARLGALYAAGEGVPKDEAEAARWYGKAAKNGVAWAQETYAGMLLEGIGLKKDPAAAFQWRRKAALHGNAVAMYNLAAMYNEGVGVEKSGFEALGWLRMAAARDDVDALNALGDMSYQGLGVPQNFSAAYQYFARSAELGNAEGQFLAGRLMFWGDGTARDGAAAVGWLTKAGEQRHVGALELLSAMYQMGDGVEKDPAKSFEWQLKAAQAGSVDSQFVVGLACMNGDSRPADLVEAYAWLSLAAEQQNEAAASKLEKVAAGLAPEQLAEAKKRLEILKKRP